MLAVISSGLDADKYILFLYHYTFRFRLYHFYPMRDGDVFGSINITGINMINGIKAYVMPKSEAKARLISKINVKEIDLILDRLRT